MATDRDVFSDIFFGGKNTDVELGKFFTILFRQRRGGYLPRVRAVPCQGIKFDDVMDGLLHMIDIAT